MMIPTNMPPVSVALRLTKMASQMPDAVAVVEPLGYDGNGKRHYRQVTFRQLDHDSDRIARGLRRLGVAPGMRIVLLVRQGVDFISLAFGLLKSGAVMVLIDPGMGRRNLIRCLAESDPEGFVAIPVVHAVRCVLRGKFPKVRLNVTAGRRWFWGGVTLEQLRGESWTGGETVQTKADDPAAIIFTTGSTGPPKGVLYRHGNFDSQVEQIQGFFGIQPGEIDLPGFPMFGLFNCAMGVTAVIPDMDPSRPAQVDPTKIIEAVEDWKVTQAFGSPAIWNKVAEYCLRHGVRLGTIRCVLSAGAPVPPSLIEQIRAIIHPEGDINTPYGATEALPVASISGNEVLGRSAAAIDSESSGTAAQTLEGAGVCVGRKFSGIQWKVIQIVDGPISRIEDIQEQPVGQIGELIVSGPVVTREYCTRIESNSLGKIVDGETVWHRMGDSGYLDEQNRFWFCGRVAHRVLTANGPMYPVCCEAIFNRHEAIYRSALVGVGPAGRQRPVIVLQPHREKTPADRNARETFLDEIRRLGQDNPLTERIEDFLFHPAFPVDIRHNAKIFREKLAVWAAKKLDR